VTMSRSGCRTSGRIDLLPLQIRFHDVG
jgi:hypothetical protein